MAAERGEGVVVTIPSAGADGGAILRKWKQGREVQPASRDALRKAKAELDADRTVAALLGPGASAVTLLWDTLERTGGRERAQRAAGAKPKKNKKKNKKQKKSDPEPEITDVEPVAGALASALTKYDDLESYFAAAASDTATAALLAGELAGEICADLGYATGSAEADRVHRGTGRYVETRFSAWRSRGQGRSRGGMVGCEDSSATCATGD